MTQKREIKPLFVSRHALSRARQRMIDLSAVKMAIQDPDLKGPARHGRLKVQKRFGQRDLVVIYAESRRILVLVTVFWR